MEDSRRMPFLFACLAALASFGAVIKAEELQVSLKYFDDCDRWAREGECVNNPGFMWTNCHSSCYKGPLKVKDDDDRCEAWAEEGECTNNAKYIQLHCPDKCGYAVAWSPWLRSKLGFETYVAFPEAQATELCSNPLSLFMVGENMRMRLNVFMQGGAFYAKGLSSAAPSEYLGMAGLAEAFLYTLRIYRLSIATFEFDPILAQEIQSLIERITNTFMMKWWDSDILMRALPSWIDPMDDIATRTKYDLFKRYNDFSELMRLPKEALCQRYIGADTTQIAGLQEFNKDNRWSRNYPSRVPHTVTPTVKLLNGYEMPVMGLGTWQLNGDACVQAVTDAIEAGYRHFDTAQAYGNDEQVGTATRKAFETGKYRRKDFFIASKISNPDDGGKDVKDLVMKQLRSLQTTYIDLYMLHSPFANKKQQAETWAGLEELYDQGYIKALGVSNFNKKELEDLFNTARIKPMVVQNKVDPYHVGKQQDSHGDAIVQYTRDKGIVLVGYSSLSAYPFVMSPVEDPIVEMVAEKMSERIKEKITPAQVILRWALQKGFAVIPRSTNKENMKANIKVLSMPEIDREEMAMIDTLQELVANPTSLAVPV